MKFFRGADSTRGAIFSETFLFVAKTLTNSQIMNPLNFDRGTPLQLYSQTSELRYKRLFAQKDRNPRLRRSIKPYNIRRPSASLGIIHTMCGVFVAALGACTSQFEEIN